MRIILIQSLGNLDQPSGFLRTCYLEPLGLEYLAASLKSAGHFVKIEYGNILPEQFKKLIKEFQPNIIGFSVYSYTLSCSLKLAKIAKDIQPDVINIFGGYHPTAEPKIIMNQVIDYVIIGEGEKVLRELVNAIEQKSSITLIPGIAYKKQGEMFITSPPCRIENLDDIPYPLRKKRFLHQAKQFQIAYPSPSQQISVSQVLHSRGCPYNCSFCSSKNMWGTKVYWRNPIKVVDEIEELYHKYGTNLIYFPDLTFNVDKKRSEALCKELIKRNLPVYWWALFRVDNIDVDFLHLIKEAKCVKLSFGIESTNNYSIDKVKGKAHYHWEKAVEVFNDASQIGLIVKAFLMIGFSWETYDDILSHKERLKTALIDELRITFATPFPGTTFYRDCLEEGIISSDNLDDFTTEIPVVKNKHISNSELIKLKKKLVCEYYLSNSYKKRTLDKIEKFPYLASSWIEYFEFLLSKDIFNNMECQNIKHLIQSIKGIGQNSLRSKAL